MFLLTFDEVAADLCKTHATTRMRLIRHGLFAVRRVAVGERATRALLYERLADRDHRRSGDALGGKGHVVVLAR